MLIEGSDYGTYTPGTYVVTVTGTINNADAGVTAPTATDDFTFEVEDPCDAPVDIVVTPQSDQTYTISTTAITIDLNNAYTIDPSYCDIVIDVSITGNPLGTQAVTETNGVVTIDWSSDNDPLPYTVNVAITYTSDSDYYPSGTPREA